MVVPDDLSGASYHRCPPEKQNEDVIVNNVELDIPNPPQFNDITDDWYHDLKERIEAKPEFHPHLRVFGNKIFKMTFRRPSCLCGKQLVYPFISYILPKFDP